jgi:hypothetical protein
LIQQCGGVQLEPDQLASYPKVRALLLDRFKGELVGLGHQYSDVDARVEALGRHHGLLTPLLDWTEKPFIGAFFAASDLLARQIRSGIDLDVGRAAVFRFDLIPEVRATGLEHFAARDLAGVRRLHAQYGALTQLPVDSGLLDVESFIRQRVGGARVCLTKFKLTVAAARQAVVDLRLHGMSYRTLFPDEQGAAMEANWLAGDLLRAIAKR